MLYHTLHYASSIIIICSVLIGLEVKGQGDQLQNIQQAINNSSLEKHDSLYYELFKYYRSSNWILAKRYAQLSKNFADQYRNNSIELKSINALAYLYEQNNQIDSSIMMYKLGVNKSEVYGNKKRLVYFSNDLGNLYERLDVYDSALHYYQLSFEYATSSQSYYDQAIALNNSGLIFYRLDNPQEAITYFEEALRIKKQEGIQDGIDLNLLNIAMCNNEIGQYEEAIDAMNELIKRCSNQDSNCSNNLIQDANYQLGLSYELLRSYDIAIDYYLKSINEFKGYNSPQTYGGALYHLALLKFDTEPELALQYLKDSEAFALREKKKRLLKDIYALYAKYYEQIGNFNTSLNYLAKHNVLKDSIFNEKMSNNMRNLQLSAQKKKNDEVLRKQQLLLERSNQISILIGIVAILAFLIAILFYFLVRTIRKSNKDLTKEVAKKTELILNSTVALKKTNEKLVRAQSEYQHLIYRSSHDLKGPITTLLGLIHLLKKEGFTSQETMLQYARDMENTALKLDVLLSRLVYISRVTEDELDIKPIKLRSLFDELIIKYLPGYSSTKITNSISENVAIITDEKLLKLAIDFLLDNAFKYSSSQSNSIPSVILVCEVIDASVLIHISDNGPGIEDSLRGRLFDLFIVGEGQRGSGIGLYVAKKALERISGIASITSLKSPTTFTVELPLELK